MGSEVILSKGYVKLLSSTDLSGNGILHNKTSGMLRNNEN